MMRKYVFTFVVAVSLGFAPGWAQQTFLLWPESLGRIEKDISTLTMYATDVSKTTPVEPCPFGDRCRSNFSSTSGTS